MLILIELYRIVAEDPLVEKPKPAAEKTSPPTATKTTPPQSKSAAAAEPMEVDQTDAEKRVCCIYFVIIMVYSCDNFILIRYTVSI